MTYTPINWQNGDTITAEKMNKMDNGWSVENTQLFSETVTTVEDMSGNFSANLTYSQSIDGDSINVIFDDTEYVLSRMGGEGVYFYGGFNPNTGPDFTEYPFFIMSRAGVNTLVTQTAGTYALSASRSAVVVSSNFQNAVSQCADVSMMPMLCVSGTTIRWDMQEAVSYGRLLYFYYTSDYTSKCAIISDVYSSPIRLLSQDVSVTASFDNDDIFTVTVN